MAILSPGPAPTRKTSEIDLNKWNIALRQSPGYQQFLESIGQGHGAPTSLNNQQQKQLELLLARAGVPVPSGMHIDPAGNLNQKNHLVRNIAITVGIGAAALATAGAAGFGPLAGAMHAGAIAGEAGGGAIAGEAGGAATGAGIGAAAMPAAIAGIPAGATFGAGAGAGIATSALTPLAATHALAGLPSGVAGTSITAGQLGSAAPAAGGGILSSLGKYGKAVAPILGNMAKSRSDAQANNERNQLYRDQISQRTAEDQERAKIERANLDLDQRKFGLTAPGTRLSTGVRGSMTANAHNVTVGSGSPITLPSGRSINPVHFSGLGADDLLSPEARQLGDQVTHDMLVQQLAGDKFDPIPETQFPGATPAQGSSILDKTIGAGATATSILGALAAAKRKQQLDYPDPNNGGN